MKQDGEELIQPTEIIPTVNLDEAMVITPDDVIMDHQEELPLNNDNLLKTTEQASIVVSGVKLEEAQAPQIV